MVRAPASLVVESGMSRPKPATFCTACGARGYNPTEKGCKRLGCTGTARGTFETDWAECPSCANISWKPIPNWMGHLVLAGLLTQLPAWVADRSMTSMTFVGLAAATLWLRWRVCGSKGLVLAALCPHCSP